MAEIADSGGGGGHKGGKKRAKKSSTRVDMTPMVDLAFLLLTFFVLTSTFSKPKIMSLVYPAKPKDPQGETAEVKEAITFLLSDDRIFYYEGEFRQEPGDGKPATKLKETDFSASGIRKLLTEKNHFVLGQKAVLDQQLRSRQIVDSTYTNRLIKAKSDKMALKVLIKTDIEATCKNFIDLVDELKINDIGVVAPVDLTKPEEDLLKTYLK